MKTFFNIIASFAIMLCLTTFDVLAMPAKPGKRIVIQPDGSKLEIHAHGDEYDHFYTLADGSLVIENEDGTWSKQTSNDRRANALQRPRRTREHTTGAKPTIKNKGLVILVEFSDKKFQTGNTLAAFDSLLTSTNYQYNKATGSAKKYFIDQSDSAYIPEFIVIGPVTLPNSMAYYGGNKGGSDAYLADFVIHTCSIASATNACDFSKFDEDNDGYVDFVYMIYAGYGEADGGSSNTIWPHNWELSSALDYGYTHNSYTYSSSYTLKCNGKIIENYACSNELDASTNMRNGIATFCHEFSHVLGMPDYYDTSTNQYNDALTPGAWSLMDYGSYNNDGRTPPNYSIYDKYYMGWATPTILNNAENVRLDADGISGRMITPTGNAVKYNNTSTIYYLENRQKKGWDKYIPGHGLVIWKVSYNYNAWDNNEVNNTYNTTKYSMLAADNSYTGGDAGDSYPGTSGITSVTPLTNNPITDITETSGIIKFKFKGGKATNCEDYEYTFVSSVKAGQQTLGDIDWLVAMSDGSYTNYNSTKGACYGSSTYPAKLVTFTTTTDTTCGVVSVMVNASMASGGNAKLEVLLNGAIIDTTIDLTTSPTSYTFMPKIVQTGELQIRLKNTEKAMYIKSINIHYDTIEQQIPVTGISVTPQSQTIYVGDTLRLSALFTPSNATNKKVTWTSFSNAIATVDQSGLVTGVKTGTVAIKATSEDGNYSAQATITIQKRNIAVTGISITPQFKNIYIGDTIRLSASVIPSNASNQKIIWSSLAENIATVDQYGLVTGISAGNVTIQVTSQDGNFIAQANIVVRKVAVTSISISPQTKSIFVDDTIQLVATIIPSNATNKNVTWSSLVDTIASVDQNGIVIGRNAGTSTISATSQDGNYSAQTTIIVLRKPLPSNVDNNNPKEMQIISIKRGLAIKGINQLTKIRIFNLSGQIMLEKNCNTDTSIQLPAGMYIVHINTCSCTETRKAIVY